MSSTGQLDCRGTSGNDGAESLELSHEDLIEAWPRLREWLNSGRADLRFQRRLEEAARHWDETERPEGSLWRPPDLDLLERFRAAHDADLTPRQLAFADTSRQAERERPRRERRTQRLPRQARAAQTLQFEATHRALVSSDPFSSVVYGLAAAEPLPEGQQPWDAMQLSATLPAAAAANRAVTLPITTGQGPVLSLIALKNGEVISGGVDGTLRRWREGKAVGDGKPLAAAAARWVWSINPTPPQ